MLLIGYGHLKGSCVASGSLVWFDQQRSSNIEYSLTISSQICRARGGVYGKALHLHNVAGTGDIDGIGIGQGDRVDGIGRAGYVEGCGSGG